MEYKMQEQNKKIKIWKIILIILFNIIYPYIIYLISNLNNPVFFIIRKYRGFASIIYELVIVYGFYLLFKAIFKKSMRSNIAIAILFNIISIISYYKVNIVQKPFLPEDILLVGNALEIAEYGNLTITPIIIMQIIITVIVLVIQGLITWYSKYEKYHKTKTRIIIGAISGAFILIACLGNWSNVSGLGEDVYDYTSNHYQYGATVNFCKNIYKLIERPKLEIYSKQRLNSIKEKNKKIESNIQKGENKPNIIVIMGESFTDITKLEGLEFSSEPIENFKNLKKNYANGTTTVSIYGGETSTSEFEFLTSCTTRFIPNIKYPYSQAVQGNTISIINTLKNNGYYTVAIHPNKGKFYNRKNVYNYFGFDKTVFSSNMKNIENYYDGKISDQDFVEEIINQYENAQADKKFIFAISMESHMPYIKEKYAETQIKVNTNGKYNLSEEEIAEIEVYTQGLYNFDKSIKYLTEYFNKKEEEVMIVIFGDHLPALNSLYEQAYGENIEKYQTPYLIWTNYQTEINTEKNISIAGLALRVLESANIELPWYYKGISEFYKQYPVFERKFVLDKNGNLLPQDTNNEQIEDYSIIQFDILFEKNIKD